MLWLRRPRRPIKSPVHNVFSDHIWFQHRLNSFREFHEALLNELRRSRYCIRVHLDAGKQVCVSPVVHFCGRATQLNLHAAFYQVSDESFVGIAGRYVPFGVVSVVVQRHVTRVCVKDRNNLSLCAPAIDIVLDELNVENGSRQIPFEHEGADTEGRLHFSQLHWDIDMERLLGSRHVKVPFESRHWYYSL